MNVNYECCILIYLISNRMLLEYTHVSFFFRCRFMFSIFQWEVLLRTAFFTTLEKEHNRIVNIYLSIKTKALNGMIPYREY